MKTKNFKHQFEDLVLPEERKLPTQEEIGNAAFKWYEEFRTENAMGKLLGHNSFPSVRVQWNACYKWLLENGHIKQ